MRDAVIFVIEKVEGDLPADFPVEIRDAVSAAANGCLQRH